MESQVRASTRTRGLRLITGITLVAALALAVIGLPGAAAAPGPTDLALTKSDSADPVIDESEFTYTIRVSNPGPNDATDVVVTDTLPSQVDYKSATASSGTCSHKGGVVTCDLGQVNSGITATMTIVVKAKRTGTASNTAALTTTVVDANSTNNQDTETTVINAQAAKGKKGKASCAFPTITGTAGNDNIAGTSKGDVIVTGAGNDSVVAGNGKDLVCTGAGADIVSGGPKDDTLLGGSGRDQLFGNTGKDALKGKGGRDKLRGNADNDFLNGGKSRDSCRGGSGRNTLVGCP